MDPDENLAEQLRLVSGIVAMQDAKAEAEEADSDSARQEAAYDYATNYHDDVNRLCDLVLSLDEWIAGGGFLPRRWREVQPTEPAQSPYAAADEAFAPLIAALTAKGWNRSGFKPGDAGAGALEVLQTGGWVFCLGVPLTVDGGVIALQVLVCDPRDHDTFGCCIEDARTGELYEDDQQHNGESDLPTDQPEAFAQWLTTWLDRRGFRP